MSEARVKIAEALAAADKDPSDFFGEDDSAYWLRLADAALAAHVQMLKDSRVVIVALPDQATVEDYGLSVTPVHGDAFGLPIAEEIPDEKGMTRTRFRSVSETRNYAAALLAAADAAEVSR